MNGITTYKNKVKAVNITLPDSLSGTTGTIFFNVAESEMTGATFTVTGSTSNGVSIITIDADSNNISERVYFYQVDYVTGDDTYTILTGTYSILPTINIS